MPGYMPDQSHQGHTSVPTGPAAAWSVLQLPEPPADTWSTDSPTAVLADAPRGCPTNGSTRITTHQSLIQTGDPPLAYSLDKE